MKRKVNHIPDQDLLAEFKSGSEVAFTAVYHQHASLLIDYASTRLDSLDEARDMIHDLFVQLWETREELEIKHSFKAFLFFCLKRRILNHYRKNSYKQVYADRLRLLEESWSPAPDLDVEAREVQVLLDSTLKAMSGKVREIYLLSREEQLSNKEIAQKLNLSEQTVKNQLCTATAILKQKFKRIGIISVLLLAGFIY